MTAALGYLIVADGTAMLTDVSGGLFVGTPRQGASLFHTRRLAERAIRRSQEFARRHGLDWSTRGYRVVAVRFAP